MLVGFDGSRAFSRERTGTENYSYQLLLHLSKIDRENNYLIYLRPNAVVKREEWPENFQFKRLNLKRFWTQIGLSLTTFKDPLDILFVSAHTLPLIRKPLLKTVMTVHDLGSEYLPSFHQFKQRLYLSFITKVQLKSATKLIAVSKATKEDLVKKIGVIPGKIEVIYEAVDRELFKPKKGVILSNSLKQFEIKPQEYFLFVGTIQPRKNLSSLIKAFAKFLSMKYEVESMEGKSKNSSIPYTKYPILALAGNKGWLSDDIYKLPKKLGIEDKVRFLGRVDDTDLPTLYSGAIGLTFPSLFEGFGLPILEAFACHCPVLTSNHSSMREIADGAAILVDAFDTESIGFGLAKLEDPKIRQKLINKGIKKVNEFSWQKVAKQTLEVLKYA